MEITTDISIDTGRQTIPEDVIEEIKEEFDLDTIDEVIERQEKRLREAVERDFVAAGEEDAADVTVNITRLDDDN